MPLQTIPEEAGLRRIAHCGWVAGHGRGRNNGVPAPLDVRDGPVTVAPAKDGLLILAGNVEIVSGTGRTVDRITKTALCRCSYSSNKPYCDGSPVAAGSKADWTRAMCRSARHPAD